MPIGAPTGIVDAAPVPILLDQINVDNAIANIIDTEENEKEGQKPTDPSGDQTDVNNSTTPEETSAIRTLGRIVHLLHKDRCR